MRVSESGLPTSLLMRPLTSYLQSEGGSERERNQGASSELEKAYLQLITKRKRYGLTKRKRYGLAKHSKKVDKEKDMGYSQSTRRK